MSIAAEGRAISELHRRHRASEFRTFLTTTDKQVPADLDVHVICDNYATHKTPATKAWLAAHPRVHVRNPRSLGSLLRWPTGSDTALAER